MDVGLLQQLFPEIQIELRDFRASGDELCFFDFIANEWFPLVSGCSVVMFEHDKHINEEYLDGVIRPTQIQNYDVCLYIDFATERVGLVKGRKLNETELNVGSMIILP